MYRENNIENYNTLSKIDSQWEFAVWLRELKYGHCDRLNSGMGREMGGRPGREGTWVYLWVVLVDVWQEITKFCKAIIVQLKKIFYKYILYKTLLLNHCFHLPKTTTPLIPPFFHCFSLLSCPHSSPYQA